MANVQPENGTTEIANELLDALCRIRIPGEARQVLDVIFRKTYGWKKKWDGIALSTFVEGTGIDKRHLNRVIKILKKMNLIITQKGDEKWTLYAINKDFDTWIPSPKKVTSPKKVMAVTQKGDASSPKKAHSNQNSSNQTISNQTIPIGTATPNKRDGNIDNILKSICIHLGIDDFASTTQQKRFFGRHLWLLFQKRGKDEFVRRLDILKNDSFKAKRLNQVDYLYRELKGFIEPISKIAII